MKKNNTGKFTKRFYMMLLGGGLIAVGIGGFIIYLSIGNTFLGGSMVVCSVVGVFVLYHYWRKDESEMTVSKFNFETPVQPEEVNCLNLYRDRIVFEHYVPEGKNIPDGFPMECLNDHRKYWLHTSESTFIDGQGSLKPFMLPDNQFYDPVVFAERVLELPAHRRVMKRKDKIASVIKTALLVVTIIIIWILIVTTTGN